MTDLQFCRDYKSCQSKLRGSSGEGLYISVTCAITPKWHLGATHRTNEDSTASASKCSWTGLSSRSQHTAGPLVLLCIADQWSEGFCSEVRCSFWTGGWHFHFCFCKSRKGSMELSARIWPVLTELCQAHGPRNHGRGEGDPALGEFTCERGRGEISK